eukprot:COSAG01_NODE_6675_length_3550_cov_106.901768_5_plen_89_part_00
MTYCHPLHVSEVPLRPADAAGHHAYLHNTHTRADRQHIACCRPGPQHLHSYAQTRASLMLLRPTRTCGELGRQKRGIRGGDTAGIVLV